VVTGSMRNRMRAQGIEAPRDAYDAGREAPRGSVEIPLTRVFLQKSLDLLDSKGVDLFRDDKEFVRVWR
jgi:hypothetical protein